VLGRLNFIVDIYKALAIAAKHPGVDPDKIILMGFSRGGQATLYAGVERFHKLWNTSGAQFAAYIPFYPDCATRYSGDTDYVAKPVRIFHGTPDDYNPVASCKAYVARLKQAGKDIDLTEYADAAHGFDTPLVNGPPMVATTSQTVRSCTIEEKQPGQLVNSQTGKEFSYTDSCVALGPHVGGNAAAREASVVAVSAFVRSVVGK
jgi:dienelactone hydrolase